jgi:hypothetical protein
LAAIFVCGDFLHGHSCPQLLQALVRIFEDTFEDLGMRTAALDSMALAIGAGHVIVSHGRLRRGEIDWSILERVKLRLANELTS